MATYSQELDGALLPVPWIAKVDTSSKPLMLKYVPHPSKPGYITLLTDLTKVYFEPLAGIRVLARQREVEEQFGQSQSQRDGAGSLDLGGEEAVDEVLGGIGELMAGLEDAELEIKAGDLYDLDVTIKSSENHWLFHMTEIRYGALEVITRHIIHPLALSIAASRRPASSTDDQIVELVSSNIVLEAVNRHAHGPKAKPKAAPASATHKSPNKRTAKSPPPAEKTGPGEKAGEIKSRLVRRRPGASKPESPGPSSSKPKSYSLAKAPSSEKGSARVPEADEEDESMSNAEEEEEYRSSSPTPAPAPAPSPPRSRKKKAVTPPAEEDQATADEHSPTPPPPSAPSQKTQQEKDDEEEEALAKKREEMKRRMGAGGGGRLVRRRFG